MDDPADSAAARLRARPGVLVAFLLVVVLAPVVAVVVTRWGHAYLPLSDEATVAMRVRDVFTSDTPLVGAYSRGFNHPGPAFFWVLAPLSGLFGGASWTMPVGTALVQGVALVWIVLLARRRGGPAFAVGAVAMVVLGYVGLEVHDAFLRAWNPYVAFPVFFLFLLQAWSLADGEARQLPWLALTGSFVVQCHIGYAPLVAAALVWAVVHEVVRRRRADRSRERVRWLPVLGATALVLVVMWTPALVDQLRRQGNLRAIGSFFTHPASVIGVREGAGLLATQFRFPPPWLGGTGTYRFGDSAAVTASLLWLLVPAVLVGVAWWATRRSGRSSDRRLVELAALAAVVAVVALSRISVAPVPFLFFWRTSVSVFLVFACGVAIVRAVPPRYANVLVPVTALLALGAVVATAFAVADVIDRRDGLGPNERSFAALVRQLRTPGLPHDAVLVRAVGARDSGFDQGLVNALDDAGVPVKVDPELGYHYGPQRAAAPTDVSEVWLVTEGGPTREKMLARPGARVIASVSPLSARAERELVIRQRRAIAALKHAGRKDLVTYVDSPFFGIVLAREGVSSVSARDAARITALDDQAAHAGGCRCAVVAVPPSSAPPFPKSDS